ncbi:MAG TPA: carboxypeptidase regulatory-like domain-containing protein [Chthonomonadaceae bacterium]|nr:carboxypeptidase regulatory-like domain-containing protein [Chthonomonadaceae bacterium]
MASLWMAAASGRAMAAGKRTGAQKGGAVVSGQVALAGKGAAREAVVTLEGEKKAAPMAKAVVDQRDKTFLPHVSVVTRGTTVQFPNNDTVFHNVFAYFNAKKFDLGMYPRGATKRVTFDKPGLVALLCNVHSEMSAYIVVVDTPYYAITDRQGHFRIGNVAPGTYTLRVWHESGAALTQSFTVKAEDTALNLTLARK